MSDILPFPIFLHCQLFIELILLTHHIDDKNVSNAPNQDDDAEHDWDQELGDDVNVIFLLRRQGHVHAEI